MFEFLIKTLYCIRHIGIGFVSVFGAIYMPILGLCLLICSAAFFFDYNKKIYGKFLISPKIFFDKRIKLSPYHKLNFYVFLIAFLANSAMFLIRGV